MKPIFVLLLCTLCGCAAKKTHFNRHTQKTEHTEAITHQQKQQNHTKQEKTLQKQQEDQVILIKVLDSLHPAEVDEEIDGVVVRKWRVKNAVFLKEIQTENSDYKNLFDTQNITQTTTVLITQQKSESQTTKQKTEREPRLVPKWAWIVVFLVVISLLLIHLNPAK